MTVSEHEYELGEEMVISDPETLKVVADSLRLQILRLLRRPQTVKEVGIALDRAPTKLYYHVGLLEKHELIRVVETNVVSGIIEKRYQMTSARLRVDEDALLGLDSPDEHVEAIVDAMLDSTRHEVVRAIRQGLIVLRDKPEAGRQHEMFSRGHARLEPGQVADLHNQLETIIVQFEAAALENAHREDLPEYCLLEIFFPVPRAD